jgi:hypothetical protein
MSGQHFSESPQIGEFGFTDGMPNRYEASASSFQDQKVTA